MRFGVGVFLAVSLCGGIVFAPVMSAQDQTSAPSPDQSAPQGQTPQQTPSPTVISPLEERQQQIRQVDPLDREEENKAKAKAARDAEKKGEEENPPIPGSIAASEQRSGQSSGPQVAEEDDQNGPVEEYSGPAVLSRSYSINQSLVPEQVKWNETAGLSSVYNTGINRAVNADGTFGSPISLLGTSVLWSFAGRHYFRHDMFSLTYTGNYSRYFTGAGYGAYNGSNQSATATWRHVLSRRLTLNLAGTGSIYSLNTVLQNQQVGPGTIANINIGTSPTIQIFDNGSKQMSLTADVTWQYNARLSFSMGTSYFAVSQDSPLLYGVTGQQARGDITYRLTRRMTAGTYYSFSHYLYPHGVGNSASNTFGLIYSYAFTRTMQLRFRGGLSEIQSLGLVAVPIDPVIAALLGVGSGLIDSYQTYRTTDFSAQFVKDFRHGSTASLAYARGVSPGNGVYQTSQLETISANFSKKIFRSYTLNFTAGHDTLRAITLAVAENLGMYQSEYGRLSISKRYRRGVGLTLTAEYRHFALEAPGFVQNQLSVNSGISWGSGTGRLWPF